ncbi:MAG: winged helix-turn-helix transcriptional regulator, partial [Candidatus Thorarchaeota archaeon]|nr:winged helix-turn-helix transcriptional regulator [Candidatus Thorarchaeota archaeon]
MSGSTKRKPRVKDMEVIEDKNMIKLLMEPTRAKIVFDYLVKGSMTVKQLSEVTGKNPGTILHHIQKLKEVGLVFEERTEQTQTGIVQRYYRASAREYRMGISEMVQATGDDTTKRLKSIITSLSVYGIDVPERQIGTAVDLLTAMINRENEVSSGYLIKNEEEYDNLPSSDRGDVSRIIRRFVLEEDSQYRELREKWTAFLRSHQK